MFSNFKVFKTHVKRVFKDINTKRTAERELINLKQKEAILIYTAQFQEILFNLS